MLVEIIDRGYWLERVNRAIECDQCLNDPS